MKYVFAAALFALVGCAAFQDKVDDVQAKVQEKVACRADALGPFKQYFTQDMVEGVLTGKVDPIETLKAMEVTPEDVLKAVEAFKACK